MGIKNKRKVVNGCGAAPQAVCAPVFPLLDMKPPLVGALPPHHLLHPSLHEHHIVSRTLDTHLIEPPYLPNCDLLYRWLVDIDTIVIHKIGNIDNSEVKNLGHHFLCWPILLG